MAVRAQGLSTSGPAPVRPACSRITTVVPGIRTSFQPTARPLRQTGSTCSAATRDDDQPVRLGLAVTQGLALSLISASPAIAKTDFSQGSFAPESYYTALGLFALSLPGLWSLIKRSPKAKIKRITFEAPGPAAEGGMSDDAQARMLYSYMKKYNYELKSTGQVVSFVGTYAASRGVAAAVTFYTLVGMGSVGLVLSIAAPVGGNLWYLLTVLSPLAGLYYWQNGTRQEEFKIKMLTDDDETRREIVVEGDDEEIMRMAKELGLVEKGKVYVKGLLEV